MKYRISSSHRHVPIVFPTIKPFAAVFMIYKLLFVGINFIDVITSIQAHSKFELPDTKILIVCYF